MNQIKIGKFIAECRKEKGLTQEALGERLGVTNKTVSRWENGHYMPDIEMLMLLSREFDVSINELVSGERIDISDYKEKAEENLIDALESSSFTLKEKTEFFKKKWLKDHLFNIVLYCILWAALIFVLKLSDTEGFVIGAAASLTGLLFYIVLYNRMMVYVEGKLYNKREK